MNSVIDKISIGLAGAQILSFEGEYDASSKWYEGVMLAIEEVEAGNEPEHCVVYAPFSNLEWDDVLANIDTQAEAIKDAMKIALNFAKAGIIDAAIECELDSDFNALDIESMVERGANKLLEAENASS
ncbi:hypothetical protein R50073_50190 (plasmid) [Maricurvus nonylphenolicus]|uniref:hypothetical protein n=1 Tax=Maricurvus nonylphenolicus TaxID=1008307 RepID=UPI0036F251E0